MTRTKHEANRVKPLGITRKLLTLLVMLMYPLLPIKGVVHAAFPADTLKTVWDFATQVVVADLVQPNTTDLRGECKRLELGNLVDESMERLRDAPPSGRVYFGAEDRVSHELASARIGARVGLRAARLFDLGVAVGHGKSMRELRRLSQQDGLDFPIELLEGMSKSPARSSREDIGRSPSFEWNGLETRSLETLESVSAFLTRKSPGVSTLPLWEPEVGHKNNRPRERWSKETAFAWRDWLEKALGATTRLHLHSRPFGLARGPLLGLPKTIAVPDPGIPTPDDGYILPRVDLKWNNNVWNWAKLNDEGYEKLKETRHQKVLNPWGYTEEQDERKREQSSWTWSTVVPDDLYRLDLNDSAGVPVPIQFLVHGESLQHFRLSASAETLAEQANLLRDGGVLVLDVDIESVETGYDGNGAFGLLVHVQPTTATIAR